MDINDILEFFKDAKDPLWEKQTNLMPWMRQSLQRLNDAAADSRTGIPTVPVKVYTADRDLLKLINSSTWGSLIQATDNPKDADVTVSSDEWTYPLPKLFNVFPYTPPGWYNGPMGGQPGGKISILKDEQDPLYKIPFFRQGVFDHEMGHALLPPKFFYNDVHAPGYGFNPFDLMASGIGMPNLAEVLGAQSMRPRSMPLPPQNMPTDSPPQTWKPPGWN